MTVSEGHPASLDDQKASLLVELLGKIAAAQFDLEAVIADLSRDGAPASALLETRSQLSALTALSRQMASASPSALAEMRAEVASVVATSQSAAQQARTTAAGMADAAELVSRAQEVRAHVDELMRGMKDFDPSLRFESEREQAEYRQRESERLAYIAAQQVKGTPEGDLNASGAALGQLADAAAHGAGDNPAFKKRWDDLVASTEKLREAAKANGVSTEEFDRRLREDLRRIMKSKGLSDAQIDAQFAAHPDPLEAVKGYVDGRAIEDIGRSVNSKDYSTRAAASTVVAADEPAPDDRRKNDVIGKLRGMGIALSDHPAEEAFTHGVGTNGLPAAGRAVRS